MEEPAAEPPPENEAKPALPLSRRKVSPRTIAVVLAAALMAAGWWLTREEGIGSKPFQAEPIGKLSRLDGRLFSWGFSFEPSVIDLKHVFPSRPPDIVAALTDPPLLPAAGFLAKKQDPAPGGWIAGVTAGGESRAYPGGLLELHDCINDTIGGEPVAIVYDGFSGELTAFSRRIGGAAAEFSVSGLRLDTSLLLTDRQTDPHDQSLWSPLLLKAATGPAAARGEKLKQIDVERTVWSVWVGQHPETTVAGLSTGFSFDYQGDHFADYYTRSYFVMPRGRKSGRRDDAPAKSRALILTAGEARRAYLLNDIAEAGGSISDKLGDAEFKISLGKSPFGARVEIQPAGKSGGLMRQYALWFVWDAIDPKGELWGGGKSVASTGN